MSSANTTPASMAHSPEKPCGGDQPHAHKYPGRATPKAEKVSDASHDAAALKAGRSLSMGVSASGSHKGIPTSMEEVGRHTTQPATPKFAHKYPGV
jgi:hypothetical protein